MQARWVEAPHTLLQAGDAVLERVQVVLHPVEARPLRLSLCPSVHVWLKAADIGTVASMAATTTVPSTRLRVCVCVGSPHSPSLERGGI